MNLLPSEDDVKNYKMDGLSCLPRNTFPRRLPSSGHVGRLGHEQLGQRLAGTFLQIPQLIIFIDLMVIL